MEYINKKVISSQLAEKMIKATETKAKELGIVINTAVVDTGGHLVQFSRMDEAPILSIDIAQNKAYTAIAFGIPTHEWYPLLEKDPALLQGITHTPRLVIFGGGYPIKINGQMIGGIGVSGGSAEQDMLCCQEALEIITKSVI